MNISGSIRYPFKLEFSSDKTHNPKYHKRISISIYVGFRLVQIHFYRIEFGSDFRVQFIFPVLHFFFSNINFTLCLKFKYINFIVTINYLFYFYWIDQWKPLMIFLFDLTNFKTKWYNRIANNYQMDQKYYHSFNIFATSNILKYFIY